MKKVIFLFLTSVILFCFPSISQEKKEPSVKISYTCPMHPEVIRDKPANCPKCGMALEAKKEISRDQYLCPMHKEVTSEKPGKCPKCGMDLIMKEAEKKQDQEKK